MHPKLIEIGGFFVASYGVLIALAFLVGVWLTQKLARRSGVDPEAAVNLAVYCALAGLAGAKLLMFLFDRDYYMRNPSEIFSLSTLQAGGVFQGGLIAALIVAIIYMRRHKMPAWKTADAFAPGLALGHGIGRIGCFSAGCCWGVECHRPWAVTFTNADSNRMFGTPLNIPLHPTQLYEAVAEVLVFALLYWAFTRPHRDGQILGLYLIVSSLARFGVEFYRFHEQALPFGMAFSLTQWISLALIVVGIWRMVARPAA